jgi:hypothetical protein
MNIDLFSQYIRDIFRIEFNGIETDDLIYQFNANAEPIKYIIKKDKLENTINEFLKLDKLDDTSILTKTSIETLVSIESSRPYLSYSLFKESDLRVFKDNTNQIIYEIGKPSDIYLIHMLCVMKKYELNKILPRALIFSRMNRERDNNLNNDFFDFLKNIIPRFYTLKVNSSTKKSESEFQDLSNACLFQLSYNLNIPIIQVKFFDEFYGADRILRVRRSKIEELDPPRRKYIHELISHYQLAISTESAPLQYLSFYHILEYFYESVFNEDLIQNVKNELTKPDFSFNRKVDITKIISLIKKRIKVNSEEFSFDELEALKLTLKKFFPDFEKIKEELNLYNKELLNFYKNNKVSFSDGNMVNLENTNLEDIYSNLTKRIYLTRNSIVHSKDGNKPKFLPFYHEKDLWKEIPLIRFIAEEIILANSKIIGSN